MEEYFEDPSFIYYLIDNVERAMQDAEKDLEEYKKKVRNKTMKQYIKSLKEDLNNEASLGVLKKLGTIFTLGNKKSLAPKKKLSEALIKEENEQEGKDNEPKTLDQLKRAGFPSPFKKLESKFK